MPRRCPSEVLLGHFLYGVRFLGTKKLRSPARTTYKMICSCEFITRHTHLTNL